MQKEKEGIVKKLLLANIINDDKRIEIVRICRKLNIQLVLAGQADINKTISSCIDGRKNTFLMEKKPAPMFYILPELMIFSGLSEKDLDDFLREYKNTKLESVGLKAVVTPFNAGLSLYELAEELKKEHKQIMERKNF